MGIRHLQLSEVFAVNLKGINARLLKRQGTMLGSGRNWKGLTEEQVEYCLEAWELLGGNGFVELDISEASVDGSETRFNETQNKVYLGANAFPGEAPFALARLSTLACLSHELAHAESFKMGFNRPIFDRNIPLSDQPSVLVDEAETSLFASFRTSVLGPKDIEDLIEDARDRLNQWLRIASQRRKTK